MENEAETPQRRTSLHFSSLDESIQRASNNLTTRMRRNGLTRRTTVEDEDAYCSCFKKRPLSTICTCGEGGKVLEWVWDIGKKSSCTHVVNDSKDVRFHLHFSSGTAVISGNQPMTANHHFWEVKMTSLIYGTDVMVGIGTQDADIHKFSSQFCSVLGIDSQTWGLSYRGSFHHKGVARPYASGFGQGSIIGVHLDMWTGTLSFYKNRKPLGIACTGLRGRTLYPMVSSTAARSGMRVIHSTSFPTCLQFLCCVALRKAVPPHKSVFDVIPLPRRMQEYLINNLGWLLCEDDFEIDMRDTITDCSWNCVTQPTHSKPKCHIEPSTCSDCNIPVMSVYNNSRMLNVDSYFDERPPPRDLVLVGRASVVLENHNRFQPHTLTPPKDNSDYSDEEPCTSHTKRLKSSSYNYAVGLSDSDENDKAE